MKRLLRRFAAAAALALGIHAPAQAGTSFGIDYTDLWFNPAESGWGINVIQQLGTVFATLFVYGPDNSARWYVASDLRGGQNSFTGTLYQTNGPYFGAPWTGGGNPAPVGSMTLSFSAFDRGTLTYTVNGVSVTKQIQRQTFRPNDIAGNFIGGFSATASGCADAGSNGPALAAGLLQVSQGGSSATMTIEFVNAANVPGSCTYSGAYTPSGRLGTISGTYTCSFGSSGTFTLSQVDVTRNGFNATYSASDQFCSSYSGFFGGIRDVL